MKKVDPQATICDTPSPMMETGNERGLKAAVVTAAV